MVLVSPSQSNPNDEITAASVNNPVNSLATVINGQIDDTNISGVSGSKISAGTIAPSAMNAAANPETRTSETNGNFVASGLVWSLLSALNGQMTAGVAYVSGVRLPVSAVATRAFTASKDTYISLSNAGALSYSEVANNAASPALPANSIWLAVVVTSGIAITGVRTTGTTSLGARIYNTGIHNNSATDRTWWEEIGRATLTSAGDTISVPGLPARKYLRVAVSLIATGAIQAILRFNNDSANNYAVRSSTNGAADATFSAQSGINAGNDSAQLMLIYDIVNVTALEKLVAGVVVFNSTAGAPPNRIENFGKWANTSAQINRVDVVNTQAGDYAIGSEVIVLGHD